MAIQTERNENMKTTKVQLPDGRLLKIEGADAQSTAELIANHYLAQGAIESAEDALPVPGLGSLDSGHSGRVTAPAAQVLNVPVSNEEPLEMPVMTFK